MITGEKEPAPSSLWRWHAFDTMVTQALNRIHTKRERWRFCQSRTHLNFDASVNADTDA